MKFCGAVFASDDYLFFLFLGSNDVHKLAEIIPEEFLPKSLGGTSEYDVSKHLGGGPLDQYIENLPKPKSVRFRKSLSENLSGIPIQSCSLFLF